MADIPFFPNGIDVNNQRLLQVLAGVADTDGVNKKQLDDAIAAAVAGLLDYKGAYNPVTNSPDLTTLPNGVLVGDSYIISANGTFNGESVEIGDMIIANTDEASGVLQWDILQVNIDPSLFGGSTNYVVDNQAGATALTGLKIGDIVYQKNESLFIPPVLEIITAITDGQYSTSSKRYLNYQASGKAVKNEGTADLTTSFTGNNSLEWLRVRTALPSGGLFTAVNMSGAIVSDSYLIQVDDPRGTAVASGDPRTFYKFGAEISFRKTGGNSTFEFHFTKNNSIVPPSVQPEVQSIRKTASTNGVVYSVYLETVAFMADGEQIGIQVERTSGNGSLICERFQLTGQYIAQRGFRP